VDYDHQLSFGIFPTPRADFSQEALKMARVADQAAFDLIGIQDHPYQRRFLDTWTLIGFVLAQTSRISVFPDVANLPLRPPALLAKAAASLDLLSGGRIELGLGAGGFWDAIAAYGGPRRTGPASVDALEEAIAIIRAVWAGERNIRIDGEHYRVHGAHGGPVPPHDIGIWLGAYGPRMMRVTGRLADGWLPSVPRLAVEELDARHAAIDEAARRAGRDPAAIVRACNLTLTGDPGSWPDQIAALADRHRMEAFFLGAEDKGGDPVGLVRRLGEETAPRARELVGG
jgi:alkanesulfonate monooxygenase SsuD/methylene tetrahydromethanopterin reductase-like flavin-dependent oxidoreductase (luciferase family)